ncbi:hypothetical protein Cni_G08638 [Canna indica]|uniref:Uncharacterized protein n=1 Tax=Canna indica TaxID=4628 RepID=A0AAQ3K4H3_9LILI|nr:hypothetical protein Cni_G08638 [Canna indica]
MISILVPPLGHIDRIQISAEEEKKKKEEEGGEEKGEKKRISCSRIQISAEEKTMKKKRKIEGRSRADGFGSG